MTGMITMTGPYAQHWRRRMAASVGAFLPDEHAALDVAAAREQTAR